MYIVYIIVDMAVDKDKVKYSSQKVSQFLCSPEVKNNYHSIRCDICDKKNQINCANINIEKYEKLILVIKRILLIA